MLSLLKNTAFVAWLIAALAATSIGLAALTFQATATAARLTAEAATTAIKHKKAISNALAKAKAKARLKRKPPGAAV